MKLPYRLRLWRLLARVCVRLGGRAIAWYNRHTPMPLIAIEDDDFWLKAAESSFDFWNNESDEIFNKT
jgi:hypothetical protein